MGMGLKLDRDNPSLSNEQSRLELGRELDLQQGNVNLDKSIEKVEQLADGAMRCLPKEEQAIIKKEISEFAYKNCGNQADIQSLHYDAEKNQVSATINFAHQVTVNLDDLGFSKSPEVKELLGQLQVMEREHERLEKNCGYFESMVNKAIDAHETNITQREQEINEASQGAKGLWNKLSGKLPEPYPTLEERPLTREDITQTLHVHEVKTDHFLNLLNERLPDIQQDPQVAIQNLDNLLNESRERLDNLSLKVSEAFNVTQPNNSIGSLVNQSDIELPSIEPREITDAELAQLNKELDQLSNHYTIPSREVTDKNVDDLTQSLKEMANEDKSLWDKTVDPYDSVVDSVSYGIENVVESSKTVGALGESVAKSATNTLTEGLMSAGALGVGVGVAVKEFSIDEGINAMKGTFEVLKEDQAPHNFQLSESSKEQLANSETLQNIAEAVNNQTEKFYDSVNYFGGENAEEIVRGAVEAGGKVVELAGTGAVLGGVTKLGRGFIYKPQASDIYLKTNDLSKIYESGRIWGQTEGSVYGLADPKMPRWRSMIDNKSLDAGTIHLTGEAAALFKPHEAVGLFSAMKRVTGQYKAPFGDVVFGEGKGVATFDKSTNTLTIHSATIGEHAGQSYNKAMSRLWSRRLGIDGAIGYGGSGLVIYLHNVEQ